MNQTTTLSRSLNRPTQAQRGRIVGLLMLTMAALGGLMAVPVPYQVRCPVQLEPKLRRVVSAPFDGVLTEVRRTVRGWRAMLERLKSLISSYRENPPDVPAGAMAETLHFLAWLADHNFTFLGMREYQLKGEGEKADLVPIDGKGLGILEDPKFYFLRDGPKYVEMTPQHIEFLQTAEPLMVTKANVRARVHRRAQDYAHMAVRVVRGAKSSTR